MDIEFVSISVDSKNDYEKWRAMVPEKNVGGIQLFSDEGIRSDFMKFHGVSMIPRYMILDAEGNVVSRMAPRPSSAEIREYINKLLGEKNRIIIDIHDSN